jgi:dGTPase
LLVGWVLREIEMVFEEAGIECDRSYEPPVSGARRSFVEQHYHTLDFSNVDDAKRLLVAVEGVLNKASRKLVDQPEPVAQRKLEDLIEAIALAHDLGHTPFGHAGQDALAACMKPYGGFEHNLQSLRVVDELEERYGAFNGLNLTFETREGILKHCSRANARRLGDLGERFLKRRQPGIEAQIANLADEIAYNNHDVDDGLRSGLLSLAQLDEVPLFARHAAAVRAEYPGIAERRMIHETVRRMINALVLDLVAESARRIAAAGRGSIEEVRAAPPLVAFSAATRREADAMKAFLFDNLYRHYRVVRMTTKARRIVTELFAAFLDEPRLLPPDHQHRARIDKPRAIADYVAGMTDRYAIKEHQRLFGIEEK